ncbi:hypothetical protein PVK06_027981 [Gossypium arboreum]|uniref:Uncharacterized protein n=1 Tax=Gossypium arboreum TaxID=29729 RepID=A0ABR0P489_GOSAR|nr:hypothetical protein PVK06_027981 [Gossypium arboreum]
MEKTRGSVKKATKSVGKHGSFVTIIRELESLRPVQTNGQIIFLNKIEKERFHNKMLKQKFHPEQGIFLSPQQDLGKQVYKTISKLMWETFCTHPRSYSPSWKRRTVPLTGEKVLENKGPINEAFVERMTCGKGTLILKEVKTSKTRKGKAKADNKGTNLNAETSLRSKLKDVEKNGKFHQQ